MKARWITIPAIAMMIIGAGRALTTEKVLPEPLATTARAAQTQSIEAFAEDNGCLKCHSVDKKIIGPAYRSVAAKYKDKPGARAALIEKVKNGGKGNWTKLTGGVPMPPYSPRLSDVEITRLVDWILGLEDNEIK